MAKRQFVVDSSTLKNKKVRLIPLDEVSKKEYIDWFITEKVSNFQKISIGNNHFTKSLCKKSVNKILIIDKYEELIWFTKQYTIIKPESARTINWNKLMDDYGGVLFSNYKKLYNQIYDLFKKNVRRWIWFLSIQPQQCIVWNL